MNSTENLTRREMIRSAAIAAAVCVAPAMAGAAEKEKKKKEEKKEEPARPPNPAKWRGLKVGCASYTFRKFPVADAIKGMVRVQLPYVSIKDFHLSLKSTTDERKAVAKQFRDAGIEVLSCGVIKEKNEAGWRNAFEYTRDIGAPVMVTMPPADNLPILEKLVKEFKDIKIAIHNHGPEDKEFPSPYDVMKAIDKLDPRIGLCIDVGHTARAKADPVKAIRELKDRLFDIHMKDVYVLEGKPASVEIEVGRGMLDVKGMMQALLDIKFQGHIGFEFERDQNDPTAGLAECVGYTKGVLAGIA